MIINTGARTDTAQWYAPWLLRRFEEGFVFVRNPLFPRLLTALSFVARTTRRSCLDCG
jgi:hypothetical protein